MTGPSTTCRPPRAPSRLAGVIRPPGSKSLTNRYFILAALCRGEGVVRRALASEDTDGLLAGLETLGTILRCEGDVLRIDGGDGRFPAGGRVDIGAGGTPARFLLAAATRARAPVEIDGTARMRARPMSDGIRLLQELGAEIESLGESQHLPVRVHPLPEPMASRLVVRPTASSQFVSALMLVAPCWTEGITIEFEGSPTSASYLELTLDTLRTVGVGVEVGRTGSGALRSVHVPGGGISGFDVTVEADASSAIYPAILAASIPDSRIEIEGVVLDGLQPDAAAIRTLVDFGARVRPGTGSIVVEGAARLRGCELDCAAFPDAAVGLAALASLAEGPSRLHGLSTLRVKECDRVHALATELRRVGCRVEEEEASLLIDPVGVGGTGPEATIATYDDHRMAMAFAVVGAIRGGIDIEDPGCVAKSYPEFWADWASLLSGRE